MANRAKTAAIKTKVVSMVTGEQKWRPPEKDELKLNVDASVFCEADSFTIGMVLRDYRGHFIAGRNMRMVKPASVFEAETIGVLEALSWLLSSTTQRVTVETDSLLTVQAWAKWMNINLRWGTC